jgi:hypothetical protein
MFWAFANHIPFVVCDLKFQEMLVNLQTQIAYSRARKVSSVKKLKMLRISCVPSSESIHLPKIGAKKIVQKCTFSCNIWAQ